MKKSDHYLILALLVLILSNTSHNHILGAFWGSTAIVLAVMSIALRWTEK